MDTTDSGEALLRVWLSLTAVICNRRMVSGMTFNEAVVCNHLLHQERTAPDAPLTATDLCEKTSLLKSQMNQVLSVLERQGYLIRQRSAADRRQVNLSLSPAGKAAYQAAHRQASMMTGALVERMGKDEVDALTKQFEQIIAMVQEIQDTWQKGIVCESEL